MTEQEIEDFKKDMIGVVERDIYMLALACIEMDAEDNYPNISSYINTSPDGIDAMRKHIKKLMPVFPTLDNMFEKYGDQFPVLLEHARINNV